MTWQEGRSLVQCQNGAFLCGVCRFSPSSSQSPGRHEAKRCGRLTLSGCRPSLQEVLAAHAGSIARTTFDRTLKKNVPYAFLVYGKAAQYTTNREKEAKLCSHCKTKNRRKKKGSSSLTRHNQERSENHRSTAWLLLKIHFDKCCVPWVTLHGSIK